jgi:hypothetical protein
MCSVGRVRRPRTYPPHQTHLASAEPPVKRGVAESVLSPLAQQLVGLRWSEQRASVLGRSRRPLFQSLPVSIPLASGAMSVFMFSRIVARSASPGGGWGDIVDCGDDGDGAA